MYNMYIPSHMYLESLKDKKKISNDMYLMIS